MTSSSQRVASAQLQLVEHEQQPQRLLLLVVLHDCLARSPLHSHRQPASLRTCSIIWARVRCRPTACSPVCSVEEAAAALPRLRAPLSSLQPHHCFHDLPKGTPLHEATKHEDSDEDDDLPPTTLEAAPTCAARPSVASASSRSRGETSWGMDRMVTAGSRMPCPCPTRSPAKFPCLTVVSAGVWYILYFWWWQFFFAATHVKYLEMTVQQLQMRLKQAESEVQRLHTVNEALMLTSCCHRRCCRPAALAILLLSRVKLRSRSVSWRTSKHRVSSA